MKKGIVLIIIILLLVFMFNNKNSESDEIRVRVIANSNSYVDQSIKNDVVLIMKKVINADDSYDMVLDKLDQLRKMLNEYSEKNNIEILLEFKDTVFPAKSLNGKIIEGGVYKTLLITIGNGNGNNYWSLLYPEYYGITFEDIDSENIIVRSFFYDLFNK